MILALILAFVSGIVVKTVDWLEDTQKSRSIMKYVFAIIYGLILGFIISTASFAMLFLGALMAQIFARKIDTYAHLAGFASCALTILYLGAPPLEILPLGVFFVLATLDEVEFAGKLKMFSDNRLFLKIGAFAFVIFGRWDYFAGIIAFDIGYELLNFVTLKLAGKRK